VKMGAALLAGLVFLACSDDEPELPDDERTRQIAGLAELAANAYAAAGPVGLYDYLAPDVVDRCSKDEVNDALAEEGMPDGFRRLEGVTFDGDEARATVVQLFQDGERGSEWAFVSVSDSAWRITSVPGLERCSN